MWEITIFKIYKHKELSIFTGKDTLIRHCQLVKGADKTDFQLTWPPA